MTHTYYEQQFCNECIAVHWMEVTQARQEICHGEQFSPQSDPTHYTRRLGHGVELIEKVNHQAVAEDYNRTDHAFTQYLLVERENA